MRAPRIARLATALLTIALPGLALAADSSPPDGHGLLVHEGRTLGYGPRYTTAFGPVLFEWGETAEFLTSVDRFPGLPLYYVSAAAQAIILICLCLSIGERFAERRWLAATTQMTFTV